MVGWVVFHSFLFGLCSWCGVLEGEQLSCGSIVSKMQPALLGCLDPFLCSLWVCFNKLPGGGQRGGCCALWNVTPTLSSAIDQCISLPPLPASFQGSVAKVTFKAWSLFLLLRFWPTIKWATGGVNNWFLIQFPTQSIIPLGIICFLSVQKED